MRCESSKAIIIAPRRPLRSKSAVGIRGNGQLRVLSNDSKGSVEAATAQGITVVFYTYLLLKHNCNGLNQINGKKEGSPKAATYVFKSFA